MNNVVHLGKQRKNLLIVNKTSSYLTENSRERGSYNFFSWLEMAWKLKIIFLKKCLAQCFCCRVL